MSGRIGPILNRANPLMLATVVAPTLAALLYFGLFASDVYISQSQFVVRSPDKPAATGLGVLLKSVGFSNAGDEIFIAQDFVQSRDALRQLNRGGAVARAYGAPNVSIFDRFDPLGTDGSFEDLFGDYQIRAHSPFGSMTQAVNYVLESFAAFAPDDCMLLVKEHPLDASWLSWGAFLKRKGRKLGIGHRVLLLDGGDLQQLSAAAAGMVCVNSTSGTLALEHGIPVVVLGDAVYDISGITHQAGLDRFWTRPERPDRQLYSAFKKSLHANCLVRGGLASSSAIDTLIGNSVQRLLAEGTEAPVGAEPSHAPAASAE
jgi:hypothetical protein